MDEAACARGEAACAMGRAACAKGRAACVLGKAACVTGAAGCAAGKAAAATKLGANPAGGTVPALSKTVPTNGSTFFFLCTHKQRLPCA